MGWGEVFVTDPGPPDGAGVTEVSEGRPDLGWGLQGGVRAQLWLVRVVLIEGEGLPQRQKMSPSSSQGRRAGCHMVGQNWGGVNDGGDPSYLAPVKFLLYV